MNDGGPAFPDLDTPSSSRGMSLRDYFAGQAMIGLFLQQGVTTGAPYADTEAKCASLAKVAYKIADGMLGERSKGTS